ncbi:MAG: DUF559 domain-containing protein [Nitrospirota bacterium]
MLKYNKALKHFSRELRKNVTDAEKFLWDKVRGRQLKGCQFYRQKIIGNYIVDFLLSKGQTYYRACYVPPIRYRFYGLTEASITLRKAL